jgi:hypothetical protein
LNSVLEQTMIPNAEKVGVVIEELLAYWEKRINKKCPLQTGIFCFKKACNYSAAALLDFL